MTGLVFEGQDRIQPACRHEMFQALEDLLVELDKPGVTCVTFHCTDSEAGSLRHAMKKRCPGKVLTIVSVGPVERVEGRYRKRQAYVVPAQKGERL